MRKKNLLLFIIVLTLSFLTACNTSNSSVSLDSYDTTIESTVGDNNLNLKNTEEIVENTDEITDEEIVENSNEATDEEITENSNEATDEEIVETSDEATDEEIVENLDNKVESSDMEENLEENKTIESDEKVMGVSTVEIIDVNETVWANKNCNIRKGYSTETEKIGRLYYADSITRTGICSNGWSRVDYNGSVAYISSSLLSTEKIEKPTTVQIEVPVNIDAFAYEVLNLVNNYRIENGLGTLTWNQGLADAAAIRSAEAAVCWSHTRPDGSAWNTVSNLTHGENLGKGYNSPQDVVNAWKSSPSHNANLLESRFKTLGVAYTLNEKGYVWAQEFGY